MKYLCIHGHFYQPPRENPWTDEIEKQDSAAPYHDWNERIYHECYKPNALLNNYDNISYDVGPTLLAWIRAKHPATYNEIVDSDSGNAIAMCYNHLIMPLANLNDKITQVKWAVEDFKFNFGREPEGIWLPETACNMDTLEVLIHEGIKFTILDPSQAQSVRKEDENEWKDVSDGSINFRKCYKCRSQKDPQKFITLFFYDGIIAKAIAFNDLLYHPQNLLNDLKSAAASDGGFVSIATDGETFGHHKKDTDKTLAELITMVASQPEIQITSFSRFMESHPPDHEVIIKSGENGEGTSWSCVHGVRRWKDNCGCGRRDGWHLQWRKPLRESLNWLRDELIEVYESEGKKIFKDVWKARNDYIKLINEPEIVMDFYNENASRILSPEEVEKSYKLLEMQKFAMFMFTSCGWFFSEISGIETVKILEYAARAIELSESITGISLKEGFLKRLEEAKSNITEYGNGRGVWEKLVEPAAKEKKSE